MFLKDQVVSLLNGFWVSANSSGFSILQFMDGTLVLTNGNPKEGRVVKNYFVWFEACLGLKVNTSKTLIYKAIH